jgi:hypothetical protein
MASRMTVGTAASRLLLFLPWLVLGLVGSFMAGVLVEMQGPEPYWLALLHALLLVLWAAIAVALALGGARQFLASVLLGAFLTSLTFMVVILGDFFPFVAGLGNRELELYGGHDDIWDDWLRTMLTWSGMAGALFGALGGFLAWVFRRLSRAHMKEE